MRPSLLRRASALLLLALVACDASSATPKTPSEPTPAAAALDVPEADDIAEIRRRDAHETLARWLAGDRTGNNMYR